MMKSEHAVAHEPVRSSFPRPSHRAATTHEARVATMNRALRVVGTLTFISAAATFLLQRWGVANDIERYLSLLGMTALLPIAGLICGLGLREGKSARTLLGALITILPVHFSVLGGLVYSQFAWDASAAMGPAYALWRGGSMLGVGLTVVGATALLTVLCGFAHGTFVRAHARQLTLAAIGLNAMLLIPLRTPWIAASLAAVAAVGTLLLDTQWRQSSPELRTPEGRWARAMLYVPSVLMVARAVHLYPVDEAFFAVSLIGVAAVSIVWSLRRGVGAPRASQLATAAICGAAFFETVALSERLPLWVSLLTAGLGTSAGLLALAFSSPRSRGHAIPAAATVALAATLGAGWLDESALACAVGLAVGIAAAAYGYVSRRGLVMALGVLQAGGAIAVLWTTAIAEYGIATWGGLALVGVLTVMATSFLERWAKPTLPMRSENQQIEK